MSIPPTERADLHQQSLDALVAAGTEFAQLTLALAKAEPTATAELAQAFDKLSRSVRRSIMLSRKLDEPARNRTETRRQIIRAVEDRIQRHAEAEDADSLHAELYERLDRPDTDDSVYDRPIEDLITDIARDLGLEHIPGLNHPWARRTPADIATLNARAAQRPAPPQPWFRPPPLAKPPPPA